MKRRKFLLNTALTTQVALCSMTRAQRKQEKGGRKGGHYEKGPAAELSQILGRPTRNSIALSVLCARDMETFAEVGTTAGKYDFKTKMVSVKSGVPEVIEITGLKPDTRYHYRLNIRLPGQTEFHSGEDYAFHTQRTPGHTFTFALQGDSHPERLGKMYHPDLYALTMRNVEQSRPDFYLTMGDDFSLDHLINRNMLTQDAVDRIYAHQRSFLGIVGRSAPLFLVNGNHEQAAKAWLDGTPNNPAVMAGRARTRFYPLPEPNRFYSGDTEPVEFVGLLRDYYSWTWGDALFVVIDPYWHSPMMVDPTVGRDKRNKKDRQNRHAEKGKKGQKGKKGGGRHRDLWNATLGNTQYHWLAKTLSESTAKYKFVFAHHVLGTGRGGIEVAGLYEWGGKSRNGEYLFTEKRPDWELPIHDLFVKTGVTIFFQGHDHLYAHQELDGVIYQAVPNPADNTYQAFNREAYHSGDVLPNSGHLRLTVSPDRVRVDYVASFLPGDEGENGKTVFSYSIPPLKS